MQPLQTTPLDPQFVEGAKDAAAWALVAAVLGGACIAATGGACAPFLLTLGTAYTVKTGVDIYNVHGAHVGPVNVGGNEPWTQYEIGSWAVGGPILLAGGIRAYRYGGTASTGSYAPWSPDFIVTTSGEAIPVPNGAIGPFAAWSARGFQFNGGSGTGWLSPRVSGVRVMDATLPKGSSPGYPGGYVSYFNVWDQTIHPWTGQTLAYSDIWAHISISNNLVNPR